MSLRLLNRELVRGCTSSPLSPRQPQYLKEVDDVLITNSLNVPAVKIEDGLSRHNLYLI